MTNAARPLRLRVIAGAWLLLCALVVAGLAGELWLRVDQVRKARASQRFRDANVFFANSMELNAGDRTLWAKPWFKYRPNARAELVVGGERFVIQINSQGYRTHEFELPKPKGLVRVVCIGGSTTVAGRTNEETYPARLEAKLRTRYPGLPVEVLNLGVSGVTHEYWLGRLDRVLAYEPDLVVHYEAVNDISWRQLPRLARDHPYWRLARTSLLYDRLVPFPLDALEPYLQDSLESLGAIARECRAHGVQYLAASFAGPDNRLLTAEMRSHLDFNAEFWGRRFPLHRYATYAAILERYNRRFVEYVHRQHLAYVLVHERIGEPSLFIDVCHFTPQGIELLAETFLPDVSGLVSQTEGYRAWAESTRPGSGRPARHNAGARDR
jgi:lysophospholipase L1-like esterase